LFSGGGSKTAGDGGGLSFSSFLTGNAGSPSSAAGTNGTSVVRSYIPNLAEENSRKKIFESAWHGLEENQKSEYWGFFGGAGNKFQLDASLIWPKCVLSGGVSSYGGSNKEWEKKMVGLLVDNPVRMGSIERTVNVEELVQFVFWKANSCNKERAVILSFTEMKKLIGAAKEVLTYFQSMEGKTIVIGDNLPKCPKPTILKHVDSVTRIVFYVEGWNGVKTTRNSNNFVSQVSLKMQRKKIESGSGRRGAANGMNSWDCYVSDFESGMTITINTLFSLVNCHYENIFLRYIKNVLRPFRENYEMQTELMYQYHVESVRPEPFEEDEDQQRGEDEEEEEEEIEGGEPSVGFRPDQVGSEDDSPTSPTNKKRRRFQLLDDDDEEMSQRPEQFVDISAEEDEDADGGQQHQLPIKKANGGGKNKVN